MAPLTDRDLAKLHIKFVVPLAVSRILHHQEPMDDVAEYALEEMISELEPDTALLCVALCSQYVALHTLHLPIAKVLKAEAAQIVDEYGALWLAHESGSLTIDRDALAGLVGRVPEDLESLGDLLLTLCGELNDEAYAVPAILCDILGHQAHIHRDLAEEKLMLLAEAGAHEKFAAAAGGSAAGSNVVPFPRAPRI